MRKLYKRKLIKAKHWLQRQTALFLVAVICFQVAWPTNVLALTGGPSQPEVQSFEPIGTSDMVDVFSGDFSYNIPLLDVDGYPVNISYHSGINMDQEATWVGLGWNINAGMVNRNLRGLPDDFAGESVTKKFNMKPNKTWGVSGNISLELFGSDKLKLGVGGSYGFNFNNYTGPSVIKSLNVNISAGLGGMGRLNGGLGLTSSSDEGLTVQPSLGFSKTIENGSKAETSLGINIGTAFNSRGGLKQLTIGASASVSYKGDYIPNNVEYTNPKGEKTVVDAGGSNATGSLGSQGASGTFDFGQATYTPKIDMPMKNFSMSGNFTLGGEAWGVHGKIGLGGFYSSQGLAKSSISNPAYGYLYAEKGQSNDNALMDYNREKDGTFTDNSPSLPLTNLTFDTYNVVGQGIGGSYRPFRGDIGHVFDANSYTTNDNDALTAEVGMGGYVHAGTNITIIDVLSKSGKWKSDNDAVNSLVYTNKVSGSDFENIYFKEANEKTVDSDPTFYQTVGSDKAVRFDVDFGKFDHRVKKGFVDQSGNTYSYSGPLKRQKRDKKTQNISFLKYSEYNDFSLDNSYLPFFSSSAQPHHIAEITALGTDGKKYVYGLPAYNNLQKEITFSVGSTNLTNHTNYGALSDAPTKGLARIKALDNSLGNSWGLDNYFSSTETPPYAHSYLLTSVLSSDYIDADSIRGPSDKDFGSYTKFRYSKVANYNWRTPVEDGMATYSEGLKSDFTDDKANIIYGVKDLYFLDSIITKNYIAVFHKSLRDDGLSVVGEMGGVGAASSVRTMKLDSISLYSKRELSVPVKRVHFEYSYDLCKKIGNSAIGQGKLTLKKIYFSYRNSNLAKLSPYQFDYHETVSAENPDYNLKGYDRWGSYKPNNATTIGVSDVTNSTGNSNSFIGAVALPPSDYPYVDQNRAVTDINVAAWSLKEINLPSGGIVKVNYEADDYAYVQNKKAAEMFKVINYVLDTSLVTTTNVDSSNTQVHFGAPSGFFIFKASPGTPKVVDYIDGITNVYFRFLTNIRTTNKPNLEYVSGYGQFQSLGFIKRGGVFYGCLKLKNVTTNDNNGSTINPVVKTGINFGRLHLPKIVWDATNANFNGTLSSSILSAMVNSNFIKNIRDAVTGPNQSLFQYYNVAQTFVGAKSWIRLNSPNGHKLGGGLRVKKIEIIDNWQTMSGGSSTGEDSNYGQEYSYDLPDGRSSGVAAYEPQLGGDENPLKQPIFVNTKKLMCPDDESYVEEPFGESFFPSASVGYSYVTVKNLQRTTVNRHATGKIVHEFYTAKDFPTITDRTEVKARRGKDGPGSLRSLLKINVRDYFAASQGFVIELNDMHGKPKSQAVYQEGKLTPITSVEYKYKNQPWLNGSFKLTNDCQTVDKAGNISTNNIGMFFDMVGDFRQSSTETDSKTLELNVDVIPVLAFPTPIPGIWPGYAKDKSRFRSATLTKVVQRFGILEETIAKDLGSVVSTKNLAYDAETGDLLLTQTTTNYNDKLYSFKYPAWWYYDLMGPSYTNLGYEQNTVSISAAGFASLSNASLFNPGDEVAFFPASGAAFKTWVYAVNGNLVTFIKSSGIPPAQGAYRIKVLSSGRKNNLTTEMATITTLTDPLGSLTSNAYQSVLVASAVEFSNERKPHCNCTATGLTTNPFLNGTRGIWYPSKNYTHLTKRDQTNNNGNSNIRKDGVFESYTPFYKWTNGAWQKNANNWTYITEISEFNVSGNEVENKDALQRRSSASFGYNQKMAISVAANSQYKEQGFDGFEDYRFNPCADDHFKIALNDTTRMESHTGSYSMKVVSGTPKHYPKQLVYCGPPPSLCGITLNPVYTSAQYKYVITPSGANGNYSFSYVILSGAVNNPQCAVIGGAFQVSATGSYRIAVTLTDSKGCQVTLTLDAI